MATTNLGHNASCWICFREGPDESGKPLRRDCSCRGESAGFGHVSCLVEYAKQKSEQWDGRDPNEFVEPWAFCPNCRQDYQNELAVDLSAEFGTFVEKEYPGDQWKQLVALKQKLGALMRMAIQPTQITEEATEIANKILTSLYR